MLAIVFFSQSCEEKIQTKFTLGSLTDSSHVTGELRYDIGGSLRDDGTVVLGENYLLAAGRVVVVRVPNSTYSPTNIGAGFQEFSDTTEANGRYAIDVPVGGTQLTGITLIVKSFNAIHYEAKVGETAVADTVKNALYTTATIGPFDLPVKGTVTKNVNYTYTAAQ